VNVDGTLFNDFATGESGDAVDFFQRASGLSLKEACRKFIELASGHFTSPPRAPRPQIKAATTKPVFPAFRTGTAADFQRLANLRNVSPDAVALASGRGLLKFARLKNAEAWIITDSARMNAQARRMDGHVWPDIGAKAWTLPGSQAAWPVGIGEAENFPAIGLCEGSPDLLAAFHFIYCENRETDCSAVAMLGAGLSIPPDALPLFARKRIRIFGHADDGGREAIERWARQLETVGADYDAFDFAGLHRVDESAVKDLNDLTSIHSDDFETERTLWNLLP